MKDFSHPGYRERRLVDVNDVLGKAVVLSRNEWKYKAEVEAAYDPHLPEVLGVAGDLSQVFLNLIVNAAQAIDEKPAAGAPRNTIHVSTSHDDTWVTITVRDTGVGIPKEKFQLIFEPFYTTKDVGKGTGQGLAIVRAAVVDRHAGQIDVASEVGVGTTFVVRLPAARGGSPVFEDEPVVPPAA
jgi:signal transduction histidine kinase